MDTSILYEKTIALWHVLLIAVGVAIVLLASPPAMRMGFGAYREEPPDRKNCFRVTWVAALIAGAGTPLVLAAVCYYLVGDLLIYEWPWVLKLVVGALLAGSVFGVCLVAMDFLLVGRSAMVWSRVLPAAIVCAVGVSSVDIAMAGSFGRFRELDRRTIDRASLESIFHGLNAYYNTYHVYPDDLRRLVDAQLVEKVQLVSVFGHGQSEIRASRSSPYSGPSDFTYVKLPPDSYGEFVWVCQSPSMQDDEGAYVLYKCGAVKWLAPQELVFEMGKSIERMRQFTQEQMSYPPYVNGTAARAPAPAASPTSVPSTRVAPVPATASASAPASMPTTRPASMPSTKPASLPATTPATDPATLPATRPTTLPTTAPASMPTTRPTTLPTSREPQSTAPSASPSAATATSPAATRPTTVPAASSATTPATAPATVPASAPATAAAKVPSSEPASKPVSGGAGDQE